VWDATVMKYLDFNMATMSPFHSVMLMIKVDEAIKKQLEDGITFSLNASMEVELRIIESNNPNAESIDIVNLVLMLLLLQSE